MADKLVIIDDRWCWRIVWEIDDGDDIGAHLGDMPKKLFYAPQPPNRDDAEGWLAEHEAIAIYNEAKAARDDSVTRDSDGFGWESQRDAKDALRRIKAAIKIGLSKRPWPQWAKEALKNGWRAPKGWQP